MKGISWKTENGLLTITFDDGRSTELSGSYADRVLNRILDMKKEWNTKVDELEFDLCGVKP